MNLSLKQRIVLSYVVAIIAILVFTLISFFYLEALHRSVLRSTMMLKQERYIVKEITDQYFKLRKLVREVVVLNNLKTGTTFGDLDQHLKNTEQLLKKNAAVFDQADIKEMIRKIATDNATIRELISQFVLISKVDRRVFEINIMNYLDNSWSYHNQLYEAVSKISQQREEQIDLVVSETKRVMLIILIIGFLALILVSMIVPAKVTFPFKKLTDAIRELQECNFDVSIYYGQKDEIGELSEEINKMIKGIKKFEEIRAERLSVELKKFDTLANLIKKFIVVSNTKGELVYANSLIYSSLGLNSDDLLHKNIEEVLLPESIRDPLITAIKRRTKIENEEVSFEIDQEREGQVETVVFKGHATVFPIRGKESAQDFYLMIISKEMFL